MFCTNCAYKSPVTGLILIKGHAMNLVNIQAKGEYIYKKYECPGCSNVKEVLK